MKLYYSIVHINKKSGEWELYPYPFYFIQSHDDTLQVATLSKQFCDLLLRRVKTQVSDVERRCGKEKPILLSSATLQHTG